MCAHMCVCMSAHAHVCMCTYIRMWRGLYLPLEQVLWPQGLVCPGASNRGYWDPVTATRCTKCLSSTAAGSALHICIHAFWPVDLCPAHPERGTGWCCCCLCLCERSACLCGQVCTPVPQPYCWLDLGSWSCGIFAPVGLPGLATFNKHKLMLKIIKNVGHLLTNKWFYLLI